MPRAYTAQEKQEYFDANIRPNGSCWEWMGKRMPTGYGVMVGREPKYAHRYSYERFRGPIPEGFYIDHLCRNRWCANPAHIEAVTNKENILRGVGAPALNAAKTHCKRGHPFDEDNTIRVPKGRECRACRSVLYARRRTRLAVSQ